MSLMNLIHNNTTTKALTQAIQNHLASNNLKAAVKTLFASHAPIPNSLHAHLLTLCASSRSLVETRKIESHLIGTSSPKPPPTFLLNRVIENYGLCGCLDDAVGLFDEMPVRDGGSWNSVIKACASCGDFERGLGFYVLMDKDVVFGNEITFASVLGLCGSVLELGLARLVHTKIVKVGFSGNVILESSLVSVYGKCGVMSDSRRMFDEIERPNQITWNVIVRRYLESGDWDEAVRMFFRVFMADVRPLSFTYSNALIACSRLRALTEGMQIHGVLVKVNFEEDDVVTACLTDMYVKCGQLETARAVFDRLGSRNLASWTSIVSAYSASGKTREARELFDQMPERNVISWNAMMAGYVRALQFKEALDFLHLMFMNIEDFDTVTVGLILKVCCGVLDVELGKQTHAVVYRNGFDADILICNALLDMYGKCGNLNSARRWFYQMSQSWDSVSWNALLTSYTKHGRSEQALTMFGEMMQWETQPSKFTFGTLLAACANISALYQGKQIHAFLVRNGYDFDIVIRGALVDMYCKCRCIEYALTVFNEVNSGDLILWNSIILGCCHNRRGKDVLHLFEKMKEGGIKPDHVTLQAVLLACISEGQAELGKHYFDSMSYDYGIIPRLEHYNSIIELFIHNGCFYELEKFVKGMPPDVPTINMLTRVLNVCKEIGFSRLGKWTVERLNELNPECHLECEFVKTPKVGRLQ